MEEHQHEGKTEHVAPAARSSLAKALLSRSLNSGVFSERFLFILLSGLAFLLPIFFLPGSGMAPEFTKMLLLEGVVVFGLFAWVAGRLRDGHIEVPKSLLLFASLLIILQFVVSAFVSPVRGVSFLGSGYDVGTVNMIAVLFLGLFLYSTIYRTRDRVLYFLAAFLASSGLLLVYHLVRHVVNGPSFLDFGIFTGPTATPVGKWNDFAVLAGGTLLLALTGLYFFAANKMIRWVSYAFFAVSLFFLLVVDFTVLWFVLFVLTAALVALAIFEGELAHRRAASDAGSEHRPKPLARRLIGHLPLLATVFLVVAFIYGSGITTVQISPDGKTIGSVVATALRAAPYSEVMLTPGLTYDIVSSVASERPFFGSGPNRFAQAYLKEKTPDLNRTPFWDTVFESGMGRIPTFFATTGLLGLLLWVLFIGFLFWKGRKVYALIVRDRVAAFIAFALFTLAIYFWGVAFFYLPNIAIFALAFMMTGALIAFMVGEGEIATFRLELGRGKRLSFIATPIAVILMIGTIAGAVLLYRQGASLVYFNKARAELQKGNVDSAQTYTVKASAMIDHDIYQRYLASLALVKLQELAQDKNMPQDRAIALANQYITDAQNAANRAVSLDPTNFENYLVTGGVYDTLATLGIGNTLPPARAEYEKALALNPHSPRVLFLLGRVALLADDRTGAKEYFGRALTERPNFLEALSVLAQLELQDKRPDNAEALLRNALGVEPTNFVLHFTLGYLQYSVRDYDNAIVSLENAVMLNPVYANAKYFLGLSYARVGRDQDAIKQFEDVETLNPENPDVKRILRNLRNGRDPLEPNIVPPEPTNEVLDKSNIPEKPAAKAAGEATSEEGTN